MSEKLSRRIELAAYVSTIVLAALSCVVLVKRFVLAAPAAAPPTLEVPAGSRAADLPGIDWKENGRTLVMVLSTECRYCTASAPFYQRIARERASAGGFRTVAVFPQAPDAARRYLDSLGVSVDALAQRSPTEMGARATPTLILVDGAGKVVQSWVGRLPEPEEARVIRRVTGAAE